MCGLSNAGLGIKQALGQGPSSSSLMKLVRKYRPPSPTHTFSAALDLRLSRPSVNQPKVIKRIRISQRLFAKRNARGRAQEMRSGSSFHFLAPDTPELLIYTVQATRDKRPVGCLNSLVWPFFWGGGVINSCLRIVLSSLYHEIPSFGPCRAPCSTTAAASQNRSAAWMYDR